MDRFELLEEVQALARTGLHYATTSYDQERYSRLLALATGVYSETLALPAATISARFAAELGQITPKVGGDAAIFDAAGQILLVLRADDGTWCLPCGWTEPNEAPAVTAVRETREETGLEVEVAQLVGVFARPANVGAGPHSMVAVVYLCRVIGGALRGSHEGETVQFWPLAAVPAWHPGHERYARAAWELWQASAY